MVCGLLVYSRTQKETERARERAAPPRPYLMQTRSAVVLEPWSTSLSLKSQRGAVIVTHYTNSHHTHNPGLPLSHNFPTFNRWHTELCSICSQPFYQGGKKREPWLAFPPYFPPIFSYLQGFQPAPDPFPPLPAACQSPRAGPPLWARGQSWRSQNYYYFCVMTQEKERRSQREREGERDMKVNRS